MRLPCDTDFGRLRTYMCSTSVTHYAAAKRKDVLGVVDCLDSKRFEALEDSAALGSERRGRA